MKKLTILAAGVLLAAMAGGARAQMNLPSPVGYLARGVAMYADKNYVGALNELRHAAAQRTLTPAEQCRQQRLVALSMLADGNPQAKQALQKWLVDWPEDMHRADIAMAVADCDFDAGAYAEALRGYDAILPGALTTLELRYDLAYRQAYCCMKLADFDRALPLLQSLAKSQVYASAARFYEGYIAYARGKYAQAKTIFEGVDASAEPGNMAPFYLAQIYYLDGDYDRALTQANTALRTFRGVKNPQLTFYKAEACRIGGESLYLTGHSDQAIRYLRKYVELTPDNPQLSAVYILGLSEYAAGDYLAAAQSFQAVTADGPTAMAQNAYVYLGQSLMHAADTDGAIMAFDQALHMTADDAARESAFYNYAVARYGGGRVPFGSAVTVFEDFVDQYPESAHADEVRQYIINGYMTDNDYASALASINRTKKPSPAILAAKQRVLYALGSRNLAAGDAQTAVEQLRQALALKQYDAAVGRETQLALGEALLRTGEYAQAEKYLQDYLTSDVKTAVNNDAVAYFDLGYAQMGLKQWADAARQFEAVIAHPRALDRAVQADTWTRLADCRYYLSDWQGAATAYNKAYALQPQAGDYPLFQQAMMMGYQDDFAGKLAGMERLEREFPTSALMADALLEKTEAQLQTGATSDAVATWQRIIATWPSTVQGRKAALQLGLTLTDRGERDRAAQTYRDLIAAYPTTDEAAMAANYLKHLAADDGTLDQYMAFMADVKGAPQTSAEEAEQLAWEAAERLYNEGKGSQRLVAFAERYPSSRHTAQAYAYLMTENADYAQRLVDNWPDDINAVKAWAIIGQAEYDRGNGEKALQAWQIVEDRATAPADVNAARMGIMRVARDLGRADDLADAADAVLASSTLGADGKTEAAFSRALAQQLRGDIDGAIALWQPLANQTDQLYGAKSAVYLAQAQLDQGNTAQATATAEKFIDSGTPHSYWLARGFIVLSDAYRAAGRNYDADQYLKALKQNYPGTEADIFTLIDERLTAGK